MSCEYTPSRTTELYTLRSMSIVRDTFDGSLTGVWQAALTVEQGVSIVPQGRYDVALLLLLTTTLPMKS